MTERQSYDAALRLAAIVDSSDDAIVSKDLNGVVRSWNRAAERLFGFSADEMIGNSIRRIIPLERHSEEDQVLAKVRAGESVNHYETVRMRKDGSFVEISLTVSPIRDASGTIIGASKIARDVGAQKKTARYAALLAEAGGILAGSLDYEVTLKAVANLAVPQVADWCAVDIVQDGEIERVAVAYVNAAKASLAQDQGDKYEPYGVSRVIQSGKPLLISGVTDQMRVDAAQGDTQRLDITRSLGASSMMCVPLVAHGRVLGALTLVSAESGRHYSDADLHFAQDLAYRAAYAVDNAKAYDQVTAANRVKDEFLATLSHELRTPLNAILGYARMLRSGLMTGEKQTRAVETVERNATSLTQIVEDVLDVSRIVSGKIRLDIQSIHLQDVIKRAVDTMLPAATAKGVRLRSMQASDAPPVSGDPERLQQVIWNLVSNAVKFTPRGGEVEVRLDRVNSHVEIVVRDSGIGIPTEFLPHIFERFRQADAGTTRKYGGLGLGLAIARHLVELHGGSVSADSAGPGEGSTFRVRLPVLVMQQAEVASTPTEPRAEFERPAIQIPDLTGLRILVVDDERDARGLVHEILDATGAVVSEADSAATSLAMLESSTPDVLVIDIGMPGMDGFDLISTLRRSEKPEWREIPAAALTAYARSEDRAKSLRLGFQTHLAKPVDPGELMATVAMLAKRNGVTK